jgi:hypothetical protein
MTMARLPTLWIMAPVSGIEMREPKAITSSSDPSRAGDRASELWMAGIRDTHEETINPCTRKMIEMLRRARPGWMGPP